MTTATSATINDSTITISGNLIKAQIRQLRNHQPMLADGQSYELAIDQNATIDSAGLAYVINMINCQKKTGGQISMNTIPENMQALISLAELEFVFKQQETQE